jgi:flagellar basal-body rod protein FlgB
MGCPDNPTEPDRLKEEAFASSFVVFGPREGWGMWDVSTQAAIGAIDALSLRGEVRAHNIANAETPGFRAAHVEFESALADAVRRGRPAAAEPTLVASPTVIDGLGNSVDLETELVGAIKDGLHRDTMVAAFNFKTGNLRVAFGGRR